MTVSLREFHRMLAHHDWYHMMSDDPRVWQRGRESLNKLRGTASTSLEHRRLMDAWELYVWGGGPEPEEPSDDS